VVGGHAYYSKRYQEWREHAAWQVRLSSKPMDGPVRVSVVVRRDSVEVEVVASSVERPAGLRGDLDNYAGKAVLDALQAGGLLRNDSQVTQLEARFA
jgi:Holliday junction resolvase RusA-like endonuclease